MILQYSLLLCHTFPGVNWSRPSGSTGQNTSLAQCVLTCIICSEFNVRSLIHTSRAKLNALLSLCESSYDMCYCLLMLLCNCLRDSCTMQLRKRFSKARPYADRIHYALSPDWKLPEMTETALKNPVLASEASHRRY